MSDEGIGEVRTEGQFGLLEIVLDRKTFRLGIAHDEARDCKGVRRCSKSTITTAFGYGVDKDDARDLAHFILVVLNFKRRGLSQKNLMVWVLVKPVAVKVKLFGRGDRSLGQQLAKAVGCSALSPWHGNGLSSGFSQRSTLAF